MKPNAEGAVDPPPDTSTEQEVPEVSRKGSRVILEKSVHDEWMNEPLFILTLVAELWLDVLTHTHTHTHTHISKHTKAHVQRWKNEPVQTHSVCTHKKKMYFHVSVPYDLVGLPELITEESSREMGSNEKQT